MLLAQRELVPPVKASILEVEECKKLTLGTLTIQTTL